MYCCGSLKLQIFINSQHKERDTIDNFDDWTVKIFLLLITLSNFYNQSYIILEAQFGNSRSFCLGHKANELN